MSNIDYTCILFIELIHLNNQPKDSHQHKHGRPCMMHGSNSECTGHHNKMADEAINWRIVLHSYWCCSGRHNAYACDMAGSIA
jgi:hypothetical protein